MLRDEILRFLGRHCRLCGRRFETPNEAVLDHVLADGWMQKKLDSWEGFNRTLKSYGPEVAFQRHQPLCPSCHDAKTLVEDEKLRERFGGNRAAIFQELKRRVKLDRAIVRELSEDFDLAAWRHFVTGQQELFDLSPPCRCAQGNWDPEIDGLLDCEIVRDDGVLGWVSCCGSCGAVFFWSWDDDLFKAA